MIMGNAFYVTFKYYFYCVPESDGQNRYKIFYGMGPGY